MGIFSSYPSGSTFRYASYTTERIASESAVIPEQSPKCQEWPHLRVADFTSIWRIAKHIGVYEDRFFRCGSRVFCESFVDRGCIRLDYSTLQMTDMMSSIWGAPPAKVRAAR